MHKVLVTGAGKIGSLIVNMLVHSNDYQVMLVDQHIDGSDLQRLDQSGFQTVALNVLDNQAMQALIDEYKPTSIVSCLPFACNISIAKLAVANTLNYFDLTEDTTVTETVKILAEDSTAAFVPQCGLAPGFIGIAAHDLMTSFDEVETVKLRVGALPVNSNNALQYSLTWSTDGLINEYANLCYGIENYKISALHPLEGLEQIEIDGMSYEAFNTSGGVGSLTELYKNKVKQMDYKTIRYPGHCRKMRFLMNDLKLKEDRPTLKNILETAIPKTHQDVVIVYASVTGLKQGAFIEKNYVNKIYPQEIAGHRWSAIQVTTAAGLCAVLDIISNNQDQYQGFIHQEKITLNEILSNKFGRYFGRI